MAAQHRRREPEAGVRDVGTQDTHVQPAVVESRAPARAETGGFVETVADEDHPDRSPLTVEGDIKRGGFDDGLDERHQLTGPASEPGFEAFTVGEHLRVGPEPGGVHEQLPVDCRDVDADGLTRREGVDGVLRGLDAQIARQVVERAGRQHQQRAGVRERDADRRRD